MVFYPQNPTMENKYTVKIALMVLVLLIFAGAYTGYNAYKNSPEWKAKAMERAQEQLLAEIAKDQAQMAEEAKALIAEMEKKKKEQEKIYQAYLSGAKMDQAELNRIQDRLKNLEYCQAMMSYECFTNSTASGAPVSSAPSRRYSLITTAYASDTQTTSRASITHSESGETTHGNTKPPAWGKRVSQADMRHQLYAIQKQPPQGQETTEQRTERKIQWVLKLGYREDPVRAIFASCKNKAKDPQHCLVVWLTLIHNEAGAGQKSVACTKRHNCLGVKSGKTSYKTYEDGMNAWVAIYNKYWYKAQSASFFYAPKGKLPPSRYCTSEHSSNSSVGCPNGLKIASAQWEKVEKIIK